MKVKAKCIECGKIHMVKVSTRRKARKIKNHFKSNPICSICKFRKLANNIAKGICKGLGYESKELKWGSEHGQRKAI